MCISVIQRVVLADEADGLFSSILDSGRGRQDGVLPAIPSRAGFVTSALEDGADMFKVMDTAPARRDAQGL
jgi:hypothetical protein